MWKREGDVPLVGCAHSHVRAHMQTVDQPKCPGVSDCDAVFTEAAVFVGMKGAERKW